MSQQNINHDHELDLAERRYACVKKQRDVARAERDEAREIAKRLRDRQIERRAGLTDLPWEKTDGD